jgi:hypothetical protein
MAHARAFSTFLLALAVACSGDEPAAGGRLGDACGPGIRECEDPLVCVAGRCRQACVTDADCGDVEACDEGVCMGLVEYCAGLDNVGDTAIDTTGGNRACVVESCEPGWEDRDGAWANGCE